MNPPLEMRILLCTLCSLVAIATAAQNEPNHLVKSTVEHSPSLLTYYFDISKPQMQLNAQVSGRPGRTAVAVTLSEPAVSRFMPVVSPQMSGMTHQVVNTWQALKNLAVMFTRVDAVNKQQAPNRPQLFPRSAVALKAASDVPQAHTDVAAIMDAAEAQGQRHMWSETSPASVLLLPNGQATAAVADVMHVSYDDKESVIRLDLDVVHEPHTISEFKPHGKQSLDADDAHYHFETAPGVKVDAAGLLSNLKASGFTLEGMHVFVKGVARPSQTCYTITFTPPNNTYIPISGDQYNILFNLTNCTTGQSANATLTYTLLSGPATVVEPSGGGATFNVPTLLGQGSFTLKFNDTVGQVLISLDAIDGTPVSGQIYRLLLGDPPPPPPSPSPSAPKLGRVTLSPLKAFRFLGDPIAIQATVFDTRGNIMPGVKVAITWFGECDKDVPRSSRQQLKTTDARGQASAEIVSDVPGVITVVAAAVYKGVVVWSQPANITYFGSAHSSHGHKGEYEGDNYGQDKDEPGEDYYRQKGGDHEEDYNRQKGGDHEEDYYRQKGDDHEEDYYRDAQLQQAEDQKASANGKGCKKGDAYRSAIAAIQMAIEEELVR